MAFQVILPNEEAWTKEIASSQTGVVQGVIVTLNGDGLLVTDSLQSQWLCCAVVEVYQDWCGPCKAVITTLKKQFFELGERPLKFYTVRFRFAASEALMAQAANETGAVCRQTASTSKPWKNIQAAVSLYLSFTRYLFYLNCKMRPLIPSAALTACLCRMVRF